MGEFAFVGHAVAADERLGQYEPAGHSISTAGVVQ